MLRARRKCEANDQPEASTGRKNKSAGDGGSARLQCRHGDDFAILGTGEREGRQSRARQLWLEVEKINKDKASASASRFAYFLSLFQATNANARKAELHIVAADEWRSTVNQRAGKRSSFRSTPLISFSC